MDSVRRRWGGIVWKSLSWFGCDDDANAPGVDKEVWGGKEIRKEIIEMNVLSCSSLSLYVCISLFLYCRKREKINRNIYPVERRRDNTVDCKEYGVSSIICESLLLPLTKVLPTTPFY